MRFLISLCAAGFALSNLVACQPSAPAEAAVSTSTPPAGRNHFRFTIDGQTRECNHVSLTVGQLGKLKSYVIEGGTPQGDNLSLTIYGTAAGTFPYRPTANAYDSVSQVQLQTPAAQFNNYKALVCPTSSGYYSTPGKVVVTNYVPGKLARGTFSGALLDANDPDLCSKQGKSFSGEFYVTQD
jgi:hypothetical protein